MDLFDKFADLSGLRAELLDAGTNPFGVCMDRVISATEAIVRMPSSNGHKVILAGTNNYLGMTFEPACVEAARTAITEEGAGTTGSRIANGTYAAHTALEQELAAYFGVDHAMVFTTGYQANLGVISGLAGPGDHILIDADCHASIYDGCTLSGATVIRFRHNDPVSLEKRLERLDAGHSNKIIIVEGIYSMIGDCAPLREFAAIKRRHNAYLLVDEAHSLGVFGENGRGVAEEMGIEDDVDFVVGTFSKSLGAIGGFCVSRHPKFELLRIASRAYMYTASPAPSNVAAVRAALPLLAAGTELRARLWRNARKLYDGLSALGFTLCADMGPIIAVNAGTREQAVELWNRLLEAGVYVNLAIPPGTPVGLSLLRCSVSAAHSEEQIEQICKAFARAAAEAGGAEHARAASPGA